MTPELEHTITTITSQPASNADYWTANASRYPFHAIQTEHITAAFARPEQLATNRHGSFMRVPFPHATPPHVLWGFQSEASRQAFLDDFGGEVWLGGAS